MEMKYQGEKIDIGFNVTYLIDVLITFNLIN